MSKKKKREIATTTQTDGSFSISHNTISNNQISTKNSHKDENKCAQSNGAIRLTVNT